MYTLCVVVVSVFTFATAPLPIITNAKAKRIRELCYGINTMTMATWTTQQAKWPHPSIHYYYDYYYRCRLMFVIFSAIPNDFHEIHFLFFPMR